MDKGHFPIGTYGRYQHAYLARNYDHRPFLVSAKNSLIYILVNTLDACMRGLSAEQIPVVVARDREGRTCDAVLRTRTAKEVGLHIGDYISPASVLCIEQSRILIPFLNQI